MAFRRRIANRNEARLFEEIVCNRPLDGPNGEAVLLCQAVQSAFDGSNIGHPIVVDPYLVHNLAACVWVATSYNRDQRIPWDESDHDHIMSCVLTGFYRTIIMAVQNQVAVQHVRRCMLGDFEIPKWLVDEALSLPEVRA